MKSLTHGLTAFHKAMQKENLSTDIGESFNSFLMAMAEEVKKQKQRIGGSFAVSFAVTDRKMRDCIRSIVPEVIFVVLTLSEESQAQRLQGRHGSNDEEAKTNIEICKRFYKLYDQAGEDEPKTLGIKVEEGMKPQDVKNQILEKLQEFN